MRSGGRGGDGTAVRGPAPPSPFADELFALPQLSLQMGELLPDLPGRQDAPQAASFAVPPFRVLVRRRGLRVMTCTAVAVGPFLHRHNTQRTLDCCATQLARFYHFGSVPCTGQGSSPAASRRMISAARGSSGST